MIVPMKKISLITLGEEKEKALRKLRSLGLVHIEISEGEGERLAALKEELALLERALSRVGKAGKTPQKELSAEEALALAQTLDALDGEKQACLSERLELLREGERIKRWGAFDPRDIAALEAKGIALALYEMPKKEYKRLPDTVTTVKLAVERAAVRFVTVGADAEAEALLRPYRVTLPARSDVEMKARVEALAAREAEIDREVLTHTAHVSALRAAIRAKGKEIELETYSTGMTSEVLSGETARSVSVAYFKGYVEKERLAALQQAAAENAWGLLAEDPTPEDNVPTKLKNNKFVSLVYPIMDFLGTVPGYFEYDISGWFLLFILIFFGIIFGDGGYGLFICALALVPILLSLIKRKPVSPLFLLIGLFGLSTVLWGTLTCTWFGLSPAALPRWLRALSLPLISNVNADKIWALPWTADGVGLTTAQNLQIFCFSLALIQLSVAHIKGAVREIRSAKLLGHVGMILQLIGMYYMVLSFVVNGAVFPIGLTLGGVPVGIVAISLIGVGFLLSFVFSNYEGSLLKSILASVKNIVSVLLGVVNVFSDIVSYIRLWAVGLAGAAISATVNELVSPFLGNFMLAIVAILLLVFGHGLNMILNILSVIVHGIRLNTLEFSSHLDMSWSGHKFKPFEN